MNKVWINGERWVKDERGSWRPATRLRKSTWEDLLAAMLRHLDRETTRRERQTR